MIRAIITLLLCNLFIAASAQKCVESADPISNEKTVVFESKDKWINTKYEIKSGNLTLSQSMYYDGSITGTASEGLEFIFKLENGDLITLKSTSEASGKANVSGVGIVTYFTFLFKPTKEQVNKLSVSPVVLLRRPKLVTNGTEDLDKKHYNLKYMNGPLKKGAACISTYF
jgi:hypothetical protein